MSLKRFLPFLIALAGALAMVQIADAHVAHHRLHAAPPAPITCEYYDPAAHAWMIKDDCQPKAKLQDRVLPKPERSPYCQMKAEHDSLSWQEYYRCYEE